jgi:hypothetical protein
MRRLVLAAVLTALVAWPAALGAKETTSGVLVQSTDVVDDRDSVEVTVRVRRADGQLPSPWTRLELAFPPGTRLNAAAFPKCSLAVLQAKGPGGCAPASRVGTGISRAQVPFRFPHEFAAALRAFNGTRAQRSHKRQLLVYVRPQAGPSWVLVGTWEGSRRSGLRVQFAVPLTYPEYVPEALVRLVLDIGARRGGASFLRAPCPATYEATASYIDGSVVTSSDRARCE